MTKITRKKKKEKKEAIFHSQISKNSPSYSPTHAHLCFSSLHSWICNLSLSLNQNQETLVFFYLDFFLILSSPFSSSPFLLSDFMYFFNSCTFNVGAWNFFSLLLIALLTSLFFSPSNSNSESREKYIWIPIGFCWYSPSDCLINSLG